MTRPSWRTARTIRIHDRRLVGLLRGGLIAVLVASVANTWVLMVEIRR